MQYFGADTSITTNEEVEPSLSRSLISIHAGSGVQNKLNEFPLQIRDGEVAVRDDSGQWREYEGQDAVAAIFLQPGNGEGLELVVWGRDTEDARFAARLVPTLTGVGQPDFVVLSDSCKWRGVGGVTAMGFFDHEWNVSRSSFFA